MGLLGNYFYFVLFPLPILAIFLSTPFYDLKVTFRYIGESLENLMSKYAQEV